METIKALRLNAGLSQVELAEKLCVTQATVSQWESGRILPSTEKLPKIAEILGCNIADLFEKKECKE